MNMLRQYTTALVAVAAGFMLVGCASSPIDDTPSHDGLTPVRYSGLDQAWLRPDTDLSGYTGLMIHDTEIAYRSVRETRTRTGQRGGEFPLTEAQKARLEEIFTDTLREALGSSRRLALTDEPGPDVLRLDASLRDVVSHVPPERGGARSRVYISSIGKATVQLELRDSLSGEMLARAVDRREAGYRRDHERVRLSAAPLNWSEVQREARRTAAEIRDYIEVMHRGG